MSQQFHPWEGALNIHWLPHKWPTHNLVHHSTIFKSQRWKITKISFNMWLNGVWSFVQWDTAEYKKEYRSSQNVSRARSASEAECATICEESGRKRVHLLVLHIEGFMSTNTEVSWVGPGGYQAAGGKETFYPFWFFLSMWTQYLFIFLNV